MNKLLSQGKRIFFSEQSSIISAATVIMFMTITSQILGFVRQRVILHFFDEITASTFFAALRLPDLIFEVLIFGMFSSAFIPVFTKAIKKSESRAWDIASRIANIGLLVFSVAAIIFGVFANQIYQVVAPGYNQEQIAQIANLARVLFLAQGFFVVSYVLTGVLESLKRFLVPALAPVFYNLGLIAGTILLSDKIGIFAPAVGVVIGAALHFLIQIPLAMRLGFRFSLKLRPNKGVKSIGKLALPRLADLSFQQLGSTSELFLASLISPASYTYLTLASLLQAAPVRLFGVSLAKAALPTLTQQDENLDDFKNTFLSTFFQIAFLITPIVTLLIVLRIPTVRLFFGTPNFDWNATVETGMVLTAFSLGIPFQAAVALLSRAFYAFHETRLPVIISIGGDALVVIGNFFLIRGLGLPVWGLALSFSFGAFIETLILFHLLSKRLKNISYRKVFKSITKIVIASLVSGLIMYFLLKFLDKSVWIGRPRPIPFENLVLDTRYTFNLLILTATVAVSGIVSYLVICFLLRVEELFIFSKVLQKGRVLLSFKKSETITPPPVDTPSTP